MSNDGFVKSNMIQCYFHFFAGVKWRFLGLMSEVGGTHIEEFPKKDTITDIFCVWRHLVALKGKC